MACDDRTLRLGDSPKARVKAILPEAVCEQCSLLLQGRASTLREIRQKDFRVRFHSREIGKGRSAWDAWRDAEMTLAADIEQIKQEGYQHVRILPDGSMAGLCRLIFTTALCSGITPQGWAYRYCFENPERALDELAKLEEEDQEPTGFIARRYGGGANP